MLTLTTHKKITRKQGFAFLAVAIANFNLIGQKGDAEAAWELDPLNVISSQEEKPVLTGFKTSGALKDIPKSISVVTDDQIKAQGLKSVG